MATNTAANNDLVDLYVEKGYAKDDPNEFISINGRNFILPKGKTSKVPPYVKAEYDRMLKAREIQEQNSDELKKKAKMPVELAE